jgi:type III secretory pathway component EscT
MFLMSFSRIFAVMMSLPALDYGCWLSSCWRSAVSCCPLPLLSAEWLCVVFVVVGCCAWLVVPSCTFYSSCALHVRVAPRSVVGASFEVPNYFRYIIFLDRVKPMISAS